MTAVEVPTHLAALVGLGTAVGALGSLALPLVATVALRSRRTERRQRTTHALDVVAEAAWSGAPPDTILDTAVRQCRSILRDPHLTGRLERSTDGRWRSVLTPSRRVAARDRDFLATMVRVVVDGADRHTLAARLETATPTDDLTGLPNRARMERHLDQVLAAGAGAAVAVCEIADRNGLTGVHPRARSDRLVAAAADRLRDATGPGTYLARVGGDRFAVVLPGPVDAPTVVELARHLCLTGRPESADGPAPRMVVGICVAAPGHTPQSDALVADAETALQQARQGTTGIAVFDDRMRAVLAGRAELLHHLEHGIEHGDIVAVFQPVTDSCSLDVVGLEVLARWRRGDRLVEPAEWLALAEENGLIGEVGWQVLRAARAASERFRLPVAVNVAASQLDAPDFLACVEEAWGQGRWDHLTLEVTESALLYDAAHVRVALGALAARGVRIAIDDFGTGYNSLSRLGELPLHVLKVDRSFVREVRSVEGAAVVRAILSLAEAHGLEVVAEGVEEPEQLATLVAMGVHRVQGYMLGRPAQDLPRRAHAAPDLPLPGTAAVPRPRTGERTVSRAASA